MSPRQFADAAVDALDSSVTTRIMKVVALISLVLAATVGIRQYQLTDCLARYAEGSNRNTAARADVAESDREATRQIFTSFADAVSGDPTQAKLKIQVALARWQAQQEASDLRRSQNPIPGPPSAAC